MTQSNQVLHNRKIIFAQNSITSSTLHLRNPWVTVWWSFAFPGFGHFLINNYFWGFILMSFELCVNTASGVNKAIYYSMIGDMAHAKATLDVEWLLFYISIYIFSAWDCFRRTVEINAVFQLARNNDAPIKSVSLSTFAINILNKRKPYIAVLWSLILPGIGFFYLQRMASFVFCMVWWVLVAKQSGYLLAIFFTLTGQMNQAVGAINPQWFLYLPSIYCFSMYLSYQHAVENNKLFDTYQRTLLKQEYQELSLSQLFHR